MKVHVYLGCDTNHLARGGLSEDSVSVLKKAVGGLSTDSDLKTYEAGSRFGTGVWLTSGSLDEAFRNSIAATLRRIIESATPKVRNAADEENEE